VRKSDARPTRGERIYDFGKKFGTEFLSESIHVDDFSAHVAKLHSDGDIGFANEYEEIQSFCKKNIVVSIAPELREICGVTRQLLFPTPPFESERIDCDRGAVVRLFLNRHCRVEYFGTASHEGPKILLPKLFLRAPFRKFTSKNCFLS
jgi:hypothetical protein